MSKRRRTKHWYWIVACKICKWFGLFLSCLTVRCNFRGCVTYLWVVLCECVCVTIGHANSQICIRCFFRQPQTAKIFEIKVINSMLSPLPYQKRTRKWDTLLLLAQHPASFWRECTYRFFSVRPFSVFHINQHCLYSLIVRYSFAKITAFCLITRQNNR